MLIFRGPASGIRKILILTLVVVCWLLIGSPAHAELAANEAVFSDHSGTKCGVIRLSDGTLSVVGEFDCVDFSEGVDVTSDGRWAVIGNCGVGQLKLVDLLDAEQPVVAATIEDTGLKCIEELDIAPDDSFGIATATGNSLVAKFTLDPLDFKIIGTGGPWDDVDYFGGQPQDVHINSIGDIAVQPMFQADFLAEVDVTGDIPALAEPPNQILPPGPATPFRHHGISLSEWDDDTILATSAIGSGYYLTVASLGSLSVIDILDAPGQPEAVDITCDGTRAVVETEAGLMWIDMEDTPPSIVETADPNNVFGQARVDYQSTSSVAFSADGSLLFVAGYGAGPLGTESQIDVYDATMDPPLLVDSYDAFPAGRRIMNVATLPCSAAPEEVSDIEVAVDIEPRSCPNHLYVKSRGVVKVAILGSEDFNVMTVDPRSVQIEGVSAFNWKLKDAATPYDTDDMQGDCRDCSRKGRDGFLDLVLMFKRKDIAKAIGPANHGNCLVLMLTGQTFDGKDLLGDDVVRISTKKPNGQEWFKKFWLSWPNEHKKERKDNSCTIEKKKKPLISKLQSHWHRFDRRH